jgi:hypothetical protein
MNQNVPLQRLKDMHRELEAATDVTSGFEFTDREATTRLFEIETAIQTIMPVCVITQQVRPPGERSHKYEKAPRDAVRAFDAPAGFFEYVDETLARTDSHPISPTTKLILRLIQNQGATKEQVDRVRGAFRKFDAIQSLLALLADR